MQEDKRAAARAGGYTIVDVFTVFVTHVSEVLKQNAHNRLIARAETERLIARVREQQAGLVDELLPKVLSLGDVQRVLQSLVRERVPIRNIDAILEVLADYGAKVKEPESLAELVRERLGRSICQQLVDSQGELQVLTFDPAVEQTLAAAVRSIEEKPTLVLEPRLAEQVLRKLSEEVERMARGNVRPVLLCAPTLRRHVRRFTERLVPQLSVLSLNEAPAQLNLKSVWSGRKYEHQPGDAGGLGRSGTRQTPRGCPDARRRRRGGEETADRPAPTADGAGHPTQLRSL